MQRPPAAPFLAVAGVARPERPPRSSPAQTRVAHKHPEKCGCLRAVPPRARARQHGARSLARVSMASAPHLESFAVQSNARPWHTLLVDSRALGGGGGAGGGARSRRVRCFRAAACSRLLALSRPLLSLREHIPAGGAQAVGRPSIRATLPLEARRDKGHVRHVPPRQRSPQHLQRRGHAAGCVACARRASPHALSAQTSPPLTPP